MLKRICAWHKKYFPKESEKIMNIIKLYDRACKIQEGIRNNKKKLEEIEKELKKLMEDKNEYND